MLDGTASVGHRDTGFPRRRRPVGVGCRRSGAPTDGRGTEEQQQHEKCDSRDCEARALHRAEAVVQDDAHPSVLRGQLHPHHPGPSRSQRELATGRGRVPVGREMLLHQHPAGPPSDHHRAAFGVHEPHLRGDRRGRRCAEQVAEEPSLGRRAAVGRVVRQREALPGHTAAAEPSVRRDQGPPAAQHRPALPRQPASLHLPAPRTRERGRAERVEIDPRQRSTAAGVPVP